MAASPPAIWRLPLWTSDGRAAMQNESCMRPVVVRKRTKARKLLIAKLQGMWGRQLFIKLARNACGRKTIIYRDETQLCDPSLPTGPTALPAPGRSRPGLKNITWLGWDWNQRPSDPQSEALTTTGTGQEQLFITSHASQSDTTLFSSHLMRHSLTQLLLQHISHVTVRHNSCFITSHAPQSDTTHVSSPLMRHSPTQLMFHHLSCVTVRHNSQPS